MVKTSSKSLKITREGIIRDYRIAVQSRQASLLGRREVFTGKAKFGIFGDGKEVAQVALARTFKKGDFRSGYYRDQTLMFALGMSNLEAFFAQLYAHADVEADPASAGRSMTAHFGTRSLDSGGKWKTLTDVYNSSADVSPTASQMPRLVGLGQASKLYAELEAMRDPRFTDGGGEIVYGTIGNASCAEGLFWESVNAIGVLHVPVLLSIWDDDYGISVHNDFQITKSDISGVLSGFQREPGETAGYDLHRVKGWDYAALCETYRQAEQTVRGERVPVIVHVVEMTQPQGHSTSGSHERYKDEQRLDWEEEFDCIRKMREWILEQKFAKPEELDELEAEEKQAVLHAKDRAWKAFSAPMLDEREQVVSILESMADGSPVAPALLKIRDDLQRKPNPVRRDLMRAGHDALVAARDHRPAATGRLIALLNDQDRANRRRYSSHLHSESPENALSIPVVPAAYDGDVQTVRGFEVLNACFDEILKRYPNVVAFGEDVGQLGDVNQGFTGLQERYGVHRVSDGGIREATLMGQAIGLALRGVRPIVEIQYLDYLLYALQIVSDDLATVQYRTRGGQKAPVIIRTRGHRLEGIWHSGSPMAAIINAVRGVYVCVPRDMTQAAGFYNTMLQSDDAALIVEVLNGYRMKEKLPSNVGEFTVPLGVPEVIRPGTDVTLVTYGACCRIAMEAAQQLADVGIDVELIDVQTLLPFDREGMIVESLKKTSRLACLDEDVPGGATAYMMQQVLEVQDGYHHLDSKPLTVSAQAHRPAYGSDGDYWSKPNREQIFRAIYSLMNEAEPQRYPIFWV